MNEALLDLLFWVVAMAVIFLLLRRAKAKRDQRNGDDRDGDA